MKAAAWSTFSLTSDWPTTANSCLERLPSALMKAAAAASSPTESAPTDCAWRAARTASSFWRVWNSLSSWL